MVDYFINRQLQVRTGKRRSKSDWLIIDSRHRLFDIQIVRELIVTKDIITLRPIIKKVLDKPFFLHYFPRPTRPDFKIWYVELTDIESGLRVFGYWNKEVYSRNSAIRRTKEIAYSFENPQVYIDERSMSVEEFNKLSDQ